MKNLFICISILLSFESFAQDNCKDIIEQGLFNKLDLEVNNSFETSFDNYIVSKKFQEFTRNNDIGFNLGIPIKGGDIGFGFDNDDSSVQNFQDSYENKISKDNKSVIREHLKNQIASKILTEAWSNCMDDKSGLAYTINHSDDSMIVIVQLKWNPRFNIYNAKLSKDVTVLNGINNSDCLPKGTTIGTEWISCFFTKKSLTSDMILQIDLEDQLGSEIIKIDGKGKADKKLSIGELCFNGNMEACQQLIVKDNEITQALYNSREDKLRACETETLEENQKTKCYNEVSYMIDSRISRNSTLKELVRRISEVKGLCASNPNSKLCEKEQKKLDIEKFQYLNEIPISNNSVYSFDFVSQNNR